MRKPMIEFENFSFQYRVQSSPTLKNINLCIYEGEKVLIVGPSGSGKSTLAHCINGLVPNIYKGQLSGNLKIKGENALKHNLFKRSNYVGTVLQNPDDQFIGLTVGEDIAFKLENLEVPQAEMKSIVNEVSTLVDIKTHLKSAPHELSGGQKQRVTLAGVMVDDIDILLFDEPLANLDPAAGEQTMSLIDEISRKTHKTIVIIEHRLEDVLQACIDRIIVMNEGCIIADMTPNELLASNLLSQIGIREPLYVTALKYANCEILASMNPQSLNQMDLSRCQEALHRWYDQTEIQKERNQEDFLLEFKKVCFGYQSDSLTLKDVSFQIRKGEMLSLVGKNGAGKSTISKLISGFYQPISGTILLNGEDMGTQTIKERADKIGLVMQNPNQMISKTKIFDEVALGLRVRGVSETEVQERVIETLKICGLYPYRNWPISALSFGQKKRVSIAAILVLNPELLILDEPTAGQDLRHYTEIMEFLVELNQRGITILMITHDMHLMLEYTTRAIVITNGEVLADTSTWHVLTDDQLIEASHLKKTSLYQLAMQTGLPSAVDFIRKFIFADKAVRT
ncbi:ABC transporter ATP-binding protein [Turicibacter sanguinis]|uniref:ATP-binding cassette domain-containing protein n=3 Tax=Turicibacter sanguinis TaxID=154288 RepID=A0A6G2CPS5_9FIRM|nr:ABC transporter ATP-binding protein [Turicibacter sanguinis]MTK69556.1 ATP-binding cassette domain-containing protein [Turicibacter sanguinis]MTK81119.1 ATP-binding cassette domain-containing protein [Turicibacter sanguinis]MTK84424.1 ATP-binding cassette domain-containing protein [Turicibacter sanguinis]MTK94286.1 ATP-binding cassette domain-containing protein [Turicibacter sanguinis]MTL24715.1 ATP-binding cassette domain-containing protein [Turicibacter sanguinis]